MLPVTCSFLAYFFCYCLECFTSRKSSYLLPTCWAPSWSIIQSQCCPSTSACPQSTLRPVYLLPPIKFCPHVHITFCQICGKVTCVEKSRSKPFIFYTYLPWADQLFQQVCKHTFACHKALYCRPGHLVLVNQLFTLAIKLIIGGIFPCFLLFW